MTSRPAALALVALMICPVPVFCKGESCARADAYDWGYWAGRRFDASSVGNFFSGMLLASLGGAVGMMMLLNDLDSAEVGTFDQSYWRYGAWTLLGGTISIALPLAIEPQPKSVPGSMSAEERECFLEGYKRGARRKRVGNALAGSAIGMVGSSLLIVVIWGIATEGFGPIFYFPPLVSY